MLSPKRHDFRASEKPPVAVHQKDRVRLDFSLPALVRVEVDTVIVMLSERCGHYCETVQFRMLKNHRRYTSPMTRDGPHAVL